MEPAKGIDNAVIPTIIDNQVQLVATPEKTAAFNNYYHRFDTLPPLPDEISHRSIHIGLPAPSIFIDFNDIDESDYLAEEPEEIENIHDQNLSMQSLHNGLSLQNTSTDLTNNYRYFESISEQYQRIKRNRCEQRHRIQLSKLSSTIQEVEVERALHAFNNHRASGPDNVDIRLLKHASKTTVPILTWIHNQHYVTHRTIPKKLKQRLSYHF